jgi:ATP-dependent helicase/nuclease subunit B
MDPALRGEIYHQAHAELMRALLREGLLPLQSQAIESAFIRLDVILEELKEVRREELVPAIPQIWDEEWNAIRADLRGLLLYLRSYGADWTVELLEYGFGLKASDQRDPNSRPEPVTVLDSFHLRGAIDIVERNNQGGIRVVELKTGSPPDSVPQAVGGGEVLQPVLYALVAEQTVGPTVVGGRLFYATLRGDYTVIDVNLDTRSRAAAHEVLNLIDSSVREGSLPAAPRKDACRRCDYLPVCGPYEEERATGKNTSGLTRLRDLRKLR